MTYDLTVAVDALHWQLVTNNNGIELNVTCPLCGQVQTKKMDAYSKSENDLHREVCYRLALHLHATGRAETPYTCPGVIPICEEEEDGDYDAIVRGFDGKLWRWSEYTDSRDDEHWLLCLINNQYLDGRIEYLNQRIAEYTTLQSALMALRENKSE